MTSASRDLRVLISEPRAHAAIPYLPYVWAVIKTWCELQPDLQQGLEWLPPIHEKAPAEELIQPFLQNLPDVLGLSCYVWNWETNCRIAELVKKANPACLVVAGGPHPPYKDPELFKKHPYIDLVVIKDAEVPFARILKEVLEGRENFASIPGIYFPGPEGEVVAGPPPELLRAFRMSPYLAQRQYLETLTAERPEGYYNVIWETNRGCPYSCSFCDWGSNTMSKIRTFPMERIEEEAAWFAENQIGYILLADANFGILPRDAEVADVFNTARAKTGFPRYLHYSPAKNNPDRVASVVGKLAKSGAAPVYVFAVQHTQQDVLDAIDRFNISVDKQREVVADVLAENIPSVVQLILGCPGDTLDKWKQCFADLMDWGLHDSYQVFVFEVLPNAPAADAAYREKWQLDIKPSVIPMDGTGQRAKDDNDMVVHVDVLVGCRTYSRQDWIRMALYMSFVRTLHARGVTRLSALYLHNRYGLSYRDIYERLIEGYFFQTELRDELQGHLERFLEDAAYSLDVLFEKPDEGVAMYLEMSLWVFVQYGLRRDALFPELKAFILENFPGGDELEDLMDYQNQLLIVPGSPLGADKKARPRYDWPAYFAAHEIWAGRVRHEVAPTVCEKELSFHVDLQQVPGVDAGESVLSLKNWLMMVRDLQRKSHTNYQVDEMPEVR